MRIVREEEQVEMGRTNLAVSSLLPAEQVHDCSVLIFRGKFTLRFVSVYKGQFE